MIFMLWWFFLQEGGGGGRGYVPLGNLVDISAKMWGSKGKTMDDKSINIPHDDTHNYPFCRLKFVVETFEHLT